MENKTALMQLIEILKNKEELSVLHKEAYKSISYEVRKLLPIEKQHIEDAFLDGFETDLFEIDKTAEQYYSQTFERKNN